MNRSYDDILSRISDKPVWWQEEGVPRFDPFTPDESTGVYTNEAALLEIACQYCAQTCLALVETAATDRRIATEIREGTVRYGDPPHFGCCGAGRASNSVTIRVVEYWAKAHPEYVEGNRVIDNRYNEWRRDPSLEIAIPWE